MSDNEQKQYPRGQVSFGAGDLQQCYGAKFSFTNGAKVVSTLRRNPSGVTVGNKAVSVTFETRIDEDGPERDWFKKVSEASPEQARFKFPGGVTKTINCTASQLDADFTLEDGVNASVTLVGALVDS